MIKKFFVEVFTKIKTNIQLFFLFSKKIKNYSFLDFISLKKYRTSFSYMQNYNPELGEFGVISGKTNGNYILNLFLANTGLCYLIGSKFCPLKNLLLELLIFLPTLKEEKMLDSEIYIFFKYQIKFIYYFTLINDTKSLLKKNISYEFEPFEISDPANFDISKIYAQLLDEYFQKSFGLSDYRLERVVLLITPIQFGPIGPTVPIPSEPSKFPVKESQAKLEDNILVSSNSKNNKVKKKKTK